MPDTTTATPPPPAPKFKIPTFDEMKKELIDSQVWRSVFRGGVWKDTPRDR
ncbi:MAG: hypothetical protein HY925_14800, partial [Elusimicrobia bacterium]|nr:hypothetical protein [Elusimicrobiota bacterium]